MQTSTDGRRRRGADTRRALVAAAVDVVTTDGFDRLTLREVAGRAGVSAASATYHFGTVDDLLDVVVTDLQTDATARLADLTRRSRAGELSLLDACTAYLVDLLGPHRASFLTLLELRARIARDPQRTTDDEQEAGVVDLIQDHVGNRDRAHDLFSSVFGLAVLGAMADVAPEETVLRARMARLLDGVELLPPTATPTTPTDGGHP